MKNITISTKENAIFIFDDNFINKFSIWADEIEVKIQGNEFSISAFINSNYIGGVTNKFDDCEITVESKKDRQKIQTIEELKNLVK